MNVICKIVNQEIIATVLVLVMDTMRVVVTVSATGIVHVVAILCAIVMRAINAMQVVMDMLPVLATGSVIQIRGSNEKVRMGLATAIADGSHSVHDSARVSGSFFVRVHY